MIRTIPPPSRKEEHKLLERICIDLAFRGSKKSVNRIWQELNKAGYPVSELWVARQCKHMRTDWT